MHPPLQGEGRAPKGRGVGSATAMQRTAARNAPSLEGRRPSSLSIHPSRSASRIKLMRLIWDFFSSEFGSRHAQYEKFYGGPSFAAKQNLYRSFDFKRAGALVDKALNLPAIE